MTRTIVGGAHRAALLSVALAASLGMAGSVVGPPRRRVDDDEPQLSPRAAKRLANEKRERARERAERERRYAEMNERLLRQRIASGKDDRDDKYLHASARRRREAERASPSPSSMEAGR